MSDVGIDGFGIGARVISHLQLKIGDQPTAILADKPTEEGKDRFASYKAELAWKFREWLAKGGIIITPNKQAWLRELEAIRYRRDNKGRIQLMPKPQFKKEFGFSPDRFDAALYSFFKDTATSAMIRRQDEEWRMRMMEDLPPLQEEKDITERYSSI